MTCLAEEIKHTTRLLSRFLLAVITLTLSTWNIATTPNYFFVINCLEDNCEGEKKWDLIETELDKNYKKIKWDKIKSTDKEKEVTNIDEAVRYVIGKYSRKKVFSTATPPTFIIAGGDQAFCQAANKIYREYQVWLIEMHMSNDRNENIHAYNLAILPFGSQNILYNRLKKISLENAANEQTTSFSNNSLCNDLKTAIENPAQTFGTFLIKNAESETNDTEAENLSFHVFIDFILGFDFTQVKSDLEKTTSCCLTLPFRSSNEETAFTDLEKQGFISPSVRLIKHTASDRNETKSGLVLFPYSPEAAGQQKDDLNLTFLMGSTAVSIKGEYTFNTHLPIEKNTGYIHVLNRMKRNKLAKHLKRFKNGNPSIDEKDNNFKSIDLSETSKLTIENASTYDNTKPQEIKIDEQYTIRLPVTIQYLPDFHHLKLPN